MNTIGNIRLVLWQNDVIKSDVIVNLSYTYTELPELSQNLKVFVQFDREPSSEQKVLKF